MVSYTVRYWQAVDVTAAGLLLARINEGIIAIPLRMSFLLKCKSLAQEAGGSCT